jgi:hypothetical protein
MATAVASGAHAEVLLDQAGWHLLNPITRTGTGDHDELDRLITRKGMQLMRRLLIQSTPDPPPGGQLQIDFGERRVAIGDENVKPGQPVSPASRSLVRRTARRTDARAYRCWRMS